MPPPTGNDGNGNRPRTPPLRVIQGGEARSAAPDIRSEAAAPASPEPSLSDTLRQTDFAGSRTALRRMQHPNDIPPFQLFQDHLRNLANPNPHGGYDTTFIRNRYHYQIIQAEPGSPIQIITSQETTPRGDSNPQLKEKFRMTLKPGMTNADFNRPQKSWKKMVHDVLEMRFEGIVNSRQSYERLRLPLSHLMGRYAVNDRSIWYDNFAVIGDKVYSLRVQNLGFDAIGENPSQKQITIFENSGAAQERILKISATGEIDYSAERRARQLPTADQRTLLANIVGEITRAQEDPSGYQRSLEQRLTALNKGRGVPLESPAVRRSLIEPDARNFFGPRKEPVESINNGKKLWEWVRPRGNSIKWHNPLDPINDVRSLALPSRVKKAMRWEMVRWSLSTMFFGSLQDIRQIRPKAGHLQLHLFPEGGAELTIYRTQRVRNAKNGTIEFHPFLQNIIRESADGTTENLAKRIKQMSKGDPEFRRLPWGVKLQQAAESSPIPASVQSVPPITIQDLMRLSSSPAASTTTPTSEPGFRTKAGAWRAIQALPQFEGLRADPISVYEGNIAERTVGSSAKEAWYIPIEYSQPPTELWIRETEMPFGQGEDKITRVEVTLSQGENKRVAIYDNGQFNQSASQDYSEAARRVAAAGHVPVTRWKSLGNGLARLRVGITTQAWMFGAGHIVAYPLTRAWEQIYFTEGERQLLGTPFPTLNMHNMGAFGSMIGGHGVASVATDGVLNTVSGIGRTWSHWRSGGGTLGQALAETRIPFNNPRIISGPFQMPKKPWLPTLYPQKARETWHHVRELAHRPVRTSFARGVLQRGVPLLAGLVMLDYYENPENRAWHDGQRFFNSRTLPNFAKVGAVSLGTAGIWRGVQASASARSAATRMGLILEEGAAGAARFRGTRLVHTARGSLVTIGLEIFALSVWSSIERKDALIAQGQELRSQLGQAIDQRNQLLSQVQREVDVPLRYLVGADQNFQVALAQYKNYLQIVQGNDENPPPSPTPVNLNNAFEEEYLRIESARSRYSSVDDPGSSLALTQANILHHAKINEMGDRLPRLERRLIALRAEYGIPSESQGPEVSLRNFINFAAQQIREHPEILKEGLGTSQQGPHLGPAPTRSPIPVDSMRGRLITRQFRWKAGRDITFPHWNRERKAAYILREFSGFRVAEPDGNRRPWNTKDALAFLDALDRNNLEAATQGQAPVDMPTGPQFPSAAQHRELAQREADIIREETVVTTHARNIAANLPKTTASLDRQMEDYLLRSNQAFEKAFGRMVILGDQDLIASSNYGQMLTEQGYDQPDHPLMD